MRLRFPFLHLVMSVLQAGNIAGFFAVISFSVADPVVGGKVRGVTVPASWEGAVDNHGRYYQWPLLHLHPLMFFIALVSWVLCLAALWRIHRQLQRSKGADIEHYGRVVYWIADFVPTLAFAVTAWFFVFMPHS